MLQWLFHRYQDRNCKHIGVDEDVEELIQIHDVKSSSKHIDIELNSSIGPRSWSFILILLGFITRFYRIWAGDFVL